MHPDDIKAVFEQIPNGTQVNIIDEPIKLGWDADHLPYLQAFTSLNEQETSISDLLNIVNKADELPEQKRSNIDYEVMQKALKRGSGRIEPLI